MQVNFELKFKKVKCIDNESQGVIPFFSVLAHFSKKKMNVKWLVHHFFSIFAHFCKRVSPSFFLTFA